MCACVRACVCVCVCVCVMKCAYPYAFVSPSDYCTTAVYEYLDIVDLQDLFVRFLSSFLIRMTACNNNNNKHKCVKSQNVHSLVNADLFNAESSPG